MLGGIVSRLGAEEIAAASALAYARCRKFVGNIFRRYRGGWRMRKGIGGAGKSEGDNVGY